MNFAEYGTFNIQSSTTTSRAPARSGKHTARTKLQPPFCFQYNRFKMFVLKKVKLNIKHRSRKVPVTYFFHLFLENSSVSSKQGVREVRRGSAGTEGVRFLRFSQELNRFNQHDRRKLLKTLKLLSFSRTTHRIRLVRAKLVVKT